MNNKKFKEILSLHNFGLPPRIKNSTGMWVRHIKFRVDCIKANIDNPYGSVQQLRSVLDIIQSEKDAEVAELFKANNIDFHDEVDRLDAMRIGWRFLAIYWEKECYDPMTKRRKETQEETQDVQDA